MHIALHIVVGPLILFVGAVLLAGVWGLAGKLDQLRGGRGHGTELWPCFPAARATHTSAEIRSIGECPGTRDRVRIAFADGRWVVESPELENGSELVKRLTRDSASHQYRST